MADAPRDMLSPAVEEDIKRLLLLLGGEHAALLAELLETIMDGSGYGAVEIVVSEKRIQTLKLTQSFKPIIKLT